MNVLQQSRAQNAIQIANKRLRDVVDTEDPYMAFETHQAEVEDLIENARQICLSAGIPYNPDASLYAKYQHLSKLAANRKAFKEQRNTKAETLSEEQALVFRCNTDVLAGILDYRFRNHPVSQLRFVTKTLKDCEQKCAGRDIAFHLSDDVETELLALREKASKCENEWKPWLDDEIAKSNLIQNQTLFLSPSEGYFSIPSEHSNIFLDMKGKLISSGFLSAEFVYSKANNTLVMRCDAAECINGKKEPTRAEFWLTPLDFSVFSPFSVMTFPLFIQAISSVKFDYPMPSTLDDLSDVDFNEELRNFEVGDGRIVDYSWGTFLLDSNVKFGFAYSKTQVTPGSPFYSRFMESGDFPYRNSLYIAPAINTLKMMSLPVSLGKFLPISSPASRTQKEVRDIQSLSGAEFEALTEKLLIAMGFQTETTKASGDGGIDIVAFNKQPLLSGKYIIQCKRYTGSVGEPIIRDLYGVVNSERANKGILITSGSFTKQAEAFAADKQLELIDGKKLDALLLQYKLNPSFEHSREDGNKEAVFRNVPGGKRNELIESLHDFLFQAVGQLEEKDKMEGSAALVDAKYKAVLTHPTLANELLTEIIACVDFLLREEDNVSADELFYLQRLTGQDDLEPDDVITIAGLFPSGVDSEMLPAFAILALVTNDELNWAIPDFALTIYQSISESTLTLFDIDGEARSASLVANLNRIYSLIDR